MTSAIASRRLSGDGDFTRACESKLSTLVGAPVLLTNSGTAALDMAAMLAGLKPGDEVILPSFTFSSTANAVVLRGAVPVFVDVDPGTLNIDPRRTAEAVTPRTRAIFVVHYAGVGADMDAIGAIATQHRLLVLEDAAQALGASYRGRPLGTFGDFAGVSFHDTKNVTSGEGGCLIVNRAGRLGEAEVAREKGTNRKAFFRGEVDKYTWVDVGSSYVPSELNAAFLLAQLERLDEINRERVGQWERYMAALAPLQGTGLLRVPHVPPECVHNGHLFYLLLADARAQSDFIAFMRTREITTPFHYVPLHSAPAGRRYGRVHGSMAVTEDIWQRLVRLPIYPGLGADQDRVLDAIQAWVAAR